MHHRPKVCVPAAGLTHLPARGSGPKPADAAELPRIPVISVGGRTQSIRVLLVEDDRADANLVILALQECSSPRFHVSLAKTLAEALAQLAEQPFDVILLDLSLPDSHGIATLSRVQEAAQRIPVVVMTGLDDPSFAAYALEVGAQDYLVKDGATGMVPRAIRYAITRMNAQIERQELIRQLAEEQRLLNAELDAARVMQLDLLPRGDALSRHLAGLGLALETYFEPCSGIGGDLWGALELDDNRISIFSFDFSGHGISAALNVFRLHALIRERRDLAADPAELLRFLGRALHDLLGHGQFATMFAGVVDCARDELVWSAAGAPRPFLMVGDSIELLDTRGTPLGLLADPSYANRRIAFPPRARLFVYSDALTEATDRSGHMLGEEGLGALLGRFQAGEDAFTLSGLLDEFFAWTKLPVEDDLTALHLIRLQDGTP